jgi:magnesium-transporting ATPase (P-type)
MAIQSEIKKPSVFWLIGSNVGLLAVALIFNWKLYDVLLIFWIEILMVGFINIFKMIKVPYKGRFNKGVLKALPNSKETGDIGLLSFFFIKLFLIFWFFILYAGFSAIAAFGIQGIYARSHPEGAGLFDFDLVNVLSFIIAIITIATSHIVSYVSNFIRNKEYETVNIKRLFFSPIRRLLLVWLVIIAGAFLLYEFGSESSLLLIPYFIAKILIDIRQHVREHRRAKQAESTNS